MWSSRDLALAIIMAVSNFVYSITISQFGLLFTGIRGFALFFAIGHAINISLSLLLYEGKRWRFFLQSILVALLLIPTFTSGVPFDVLSRMPIVFKAFFVDLIFNSVYPFFESRNKLIWWIMLVMLLHFGLGFYVDVLNYYIFYPPQIAEQLFTVITYMLPVIIAEGLAGGFLGYKIYQRIKNL